MSKEKTIKWDTRKVKTQADINAEIEREFAPKQIGKYEENGKTITVYEGR